AMPLERATHLREVALHHLAERLGVEAFAERGGADDVAEHDRHRPPRPPGPGPARREGGATTRTDPSVIGRRRTARWTHHGQNPPRSPRSMTGVTIPPPAHHEPVPRTRGRNRPARGSTVR